MRKWTKSACVVLAWSILPVLVVIGTRGFERPAQASTTNASNISNSSSIRSATLTDEPGTLASVAAAPATTPTATWVVRPGQTLSGIAAAAKVPGGWQALYAANRQLIGSDPNAIMAGARLTLPGAAQPTRTTVRAGDTLSGIAAELGLTGGWQALYAANRKLIGPNPNAISAGTTLTVPRPAASGQPPVAGKPDGRPANGHPAVSPPAPASTPTHHRISHTETVPAVSTPQSDGAWSAGIMPDWLKLTLLMAALLTTLAFIAEPVAALSRRRHAARTVRARTATPGSGTGGAESSTPGRTPGRTDAPATTPLAPGTPPPVSPAAGPSGPARRQGDLGASPTAPGRTVATPASQGLGGWRPAAQGPADRAPDAPAGADKPAPVPDAAKDGVGTPPRLGQLSPAQQAPGGRDDPAESAAERAALIVQAEHERLVVTYSVRDHTVYLLTPPGEDPRTVLRAARLVVPEHAYQDLAGHLGIQAGWRLL